MIAIIYDKGTREIANITDTVTQVTETSIKTVSGEYRGIDPALAGIIIIEPAAVNRTPEDITVEVVNTEIIDGLPVPVPGVEVIGQREVVTVILTEGGPEYGIGDILPVDQVVDLRDQMPVDPETEKDQRIADLEQRLATAEADNLNVMLALTEVYELMLGGVQVALIYYRLIKAGKKTIEEVPANLRAEVQALLDADAQQVINFYSGR